MNPKYKHKPGALLDAFEEKQEKMGRVSMKHRKSAANTNRGSQIKPSKDSDHTRLMNKKRKHRKGSDANVSSTQTPSRKARTSAKTHRKGQGNANTKVLGKPTRIFNKKHKVNSRLARALKHRKVLSFREWYDQELKEPEHLQKGK
jgi:hypothetical protein